MNKIILSLISFFCCFALLKAQDKYYDTEEHIIRDLKQSGANIQKSNDKIYSSKEFFYRYGPKIEPPTIDFNQDLSKLSFDSIRALKFGLYARKGYLFKDASIRDYFCHQQWYQPIYWIKGLSFKLDDSEEAFFQKLKKRETELLNDNVQSGKANFSNVANADQYASLDDIFIRDIVKNGFAVKETNLNEIYNIYEENDYRRSPSFITTDAYLQLFNEYFQCALKVVECKKLIPLLKNITKSATEKSVKLENLPSEYRLSAEFNEIYFAVPYYLLSGKKIKLSDRLSAEFEKQIKLINSASSIGKFNGEEIDYSLFKPRGDYTKTNALKNYFKAVTWFGLIPFSLNNKESIKEIILCASVLNSSQDLVKNYKTYCDAINLFVGAPAKLSALDIISVAEKEKINLNIAQLEKSGKTTLLVESLKKINPYKLARHSLDEKKNNDIEVCFLPQRYVPDAEIFSRIINLTQDETRREFPRALDVFASFSVQSAEKLLLEHFKEADKWRGYSDSLKKLKENFKTYDFSQNIYSGWLCALIDLFKENSSYPFYMRNDNWQNKNLNSSLASWAELKHNTILYAIQESAAECGDDEHPFDLPPISVSPGYVEPNLHFWEGALRLNKLFGNTLRANDLLTDDLLYISASLDSFAVSFKEISEKEINHKIVEPAEFAYIQDFGHQAAEFVKTVRCLKNKSTAKASEVQDYTILLDDESMPIVSDVYTVNDLCLEEGVGPAQEIFVIAEINGYLYLTTGSVFSYYEFSQPSSDRLTDQEWRKKFDYTEDIRGIYIDDKKTDKIEKPNPAKNDIALQSWWTPYIIAGKASAIESENYPNLLIDRYNTEESELKKEFEKYKKTLNRKK